MGADLTFPIGASTESEGRTIGAAEFSLLHALLGARAPVHTNHQQMRASALGAPIFSGGALVALLTSGWVGSRLERQALADAGWIGEGMIDVRLRFLEPVVLGDTVYFSYRLESARPSRSRAGRYVLEIKASIRTDRHDRAAEGGFTILTDRGSGLDDEAPPKQIH